VLILPMTDDKGPAVSLATSMRQEWAARAGVHGKKEIQANISNADKQKILYVVFLGGTSSRRDS
jgi:histidyl-tRNA synthetase